MFARGTEIFKVIAVSSNTNSFGLKQCVMVSVKGIAFKACANDLNMPKKDSEISVPVSISGEKANFDFASLGFEIPEKTEDCPEEVLAEIFK